MPVQTGSARLIRPLGGCTAMVTSLCLAGISFHVCSPRRCAAPPGAQHDCRMSRQLCGRLNSQHAASSSSHETGGSSASQVLRRLRAETARAMPTGARMQVSPEQGQLMALLVEAIGARRAIEVGTFTGYSSIAIAQVTLPCASASRRPPRTAPR